MGVIFVSLEAVRSASMLIISLVKLIEVVERVALLLESFRAGLAVRISHPIILHTHGITVSYLLI